MVYLADADFPHCDQLLIPYRGVRYHLAEWGLLRHTKPITRLSQAYKNQTTEM